LDHGSHVLRGDKWNSVRVAAETALYGEQTRKELHFAALSPNDEGLSNYGDCAVTLRTVMISHRTTVFEENMLVFMAKHGNKYFRTGSIPSGCLAVWEDRGRLAIAKLSSKVAAVTDAGDFPGILLTPGPTSADDVFVELHLVGGMTVRTFAKVVLMRRPTAVANSQLKALGQDLKHWNVEWEDRSTTRS
jgi:hypothetical protein